MSIWYGEGPTPDPAPLGVAGWLRIILRGVPLAIVVYVGLGLLLVLRLVEKPLYGEGRPWTPFITEVVCRCALRILGLRVTRQGRPMRQPGAVVANHTGWIDILTLNAVQRMYFVSKDDVAGWPAIGWLARATGTVFIQRKGSEALAQKNLFQERFEVGHKLLFFPEGTSTDGLRVLPFKSTLFAAFFAENLRDTLWVQPVSVLYHGPKGADPRFYGWWGDMEFGSHLLQVLAAPRQGRVVIRFHDPVQVADFKDRKVLAAHCEAQVRSGLVGDQATEKAA